MKLNQYAIENEVARAKHGIVESLSNAGMFAPYHEGQVPTALDLIDVHIRKMLRDLEIVVPAEVEPVVMTEDIADLPEETHVPSQ